MLSNDMAQAQQHLMLLGYRILSNDGKVIIMEHPQHKVLLAEDMNSIYMMSTFLARDTSDQTISGLLLLANHGNRNSLVTRFFVGENLDFVAWASYAKPYDTARFGWTINQMRQEILSLSQNELVAYLR